MKLLRTTALTAALIAIAVSSLTSSSQAWRGWRGGGWGWRGAALGAAVVGGALAARSYYGYGYPDYSYGYGTGYSYPAYGYGTGYSYPAYAYGYGTGYGYPASRYYSSSGGYGMWENPWYSAASHPFIRRHVPLWARAAGARRHWQ